MPTEGSSCLWELLTTKPPGNWHLPIKLYLCCGYNLTAHTWACIQEKRKLVSRDKSSQDLHRHGDDSVTARRLLISAPAQTRQQNITQSNSSLTKKHHHLWGQEQEISLGWKIRTGIPGWEEGWVGRITGRLPGWWKPPLSCLGDAHTDVWYYQSSSNWRICVFYSVNYVFKKKMIKVDP